MLVVPVPSDVKTEAAHAEAPLSENFKAWALSKPAKVMRFIDAVQRGDTAALGEINEIDTLNLFNITATAPSRLLYWEPETLAIMKRVVELRTEGLCAYFSIDTGPSVFVFTDAKSEGAVARGLREVAGEHPVVSAGVAPAPHEWH
jgi:mevalonate pyrophosphate decarboxylase